MKFFGTVYYGIIVSILFFGLVMEGYGKEDCDICKPNQNNRRSFIIQNVFLSDAAGVKLDVDDCISGQTIFITMEYTAQVTTYNLRILSDLLIIDNLPPNDTRLEKIEIYKDVVPRTIGNNIGQLILPITIPSGFDCKNEGLELVNAQAFWTSNNTFIDDLCDYPPGLCNVFDQSFEVGVNGFLYNYDYVLECLVDDGNSFAVTFFITSLAGGDRPYNIVWDVKKNGFSGVFDTNGEFSYTINGLKSSDRLTADLVINSIESDNPTNLGEITVPDEILFFDFQKGDDERFPEEQPNGSFTLGDDIVIPESYTFFWTLEDGTFLSDEPEIRGIEGGTYFLTVIDENTGACRTYDLSISSRILPVIYGNFTLNYSQFQRLVNLNWSTTKEWETFQFDIERASQRFNFEKIGEVKATGWSDQLTEYVFEDKMLPLTGGTLLYRLKQVDFNGDYHYSEVLAVRVPGMEFTQGVWRAFPNPTDGNELRISLLDANQYSQEPLTLRLIHPTSQTRPITLASESDMNEMLSQMLLKIPKGVFVVEIQWGQKIEHIKVLKQ